MHAIVLAAAGGPEFGPICQASPKGMIPFLGQPLLAWVVQWLERHDTRDVSVNLRQRPYPVEAYFHHNPPAKARLRFRLENERLGTAGAVKRMAGGLRETMVVCMGDLVTAVDLDAAFAYHKAKGALVTLVLNRMSRRRSSRSATCPA